jgi:CheY-like chemotaxis protein
VRRSGLVLVVDDNEGGRLLASAVLQREGFQVDSAGSSDEVVERMNARMPDLILMDVQLPGQDGLSLTRQLKADPATAAIPIVALTAHAMASDRDDALSAGCVGYISKPIDTRTLGDLVRGFLTGAAGREAFHLSPPEH